jgi:hypothetical protein
MCNFCCNGELSMPGWLFWTEILGWNVGDEGGLYISGSKIVVRYWYSSRLRRRLLPANSFSHDNFTMMVNPGWHVNAIVLFEKEDLAETLFSRYNLGIWSQGVEHQMIMLAYPRRASARNSWETWSEMFRYVFYGRIHSKTQEYVT